MLDDSSTEDYHAGPLGSHSNCVDLADILHDVNLKLQRRGLEGVEVQHVPQTAVCERGTENGNVVLVRPIVHALLVIYLLAQAMDDLAGGPVNGVFRGLPGAPGGLLLGEQSVKNGHDPVLKETVVIVGDDEVADAVQALGAQCGAWRRKGAHVCWGEALDEVLLDAAGGGDDGADVGVLGEITKGAAQAGGDQVAGVAEEDGGFCCGVLGVGPGSLGERVLEG